METARTALSDDADTPAAAGGAMRRAAVRSASPPTIAATLISSAPMRLAASFNNSNGLSPLP
jgi:hypothetical protein